MKLVRAQIKNFRLLRDVELYLEDQTTVIVGRNNSGKTSLSEVIRRFTSDKNATFHIQDFSAECLSEFKAAVKAKAEGREVRDIRALLPFIELRMFFQYDLAQPQLGPLGEFVVDLDMACNEALVVMRFEPSDGTLNKFFEGVFEDDGDDAQKLFFREMAERIPKLYVTNVWAEDPNDPTNRKESSQAAVKNVLKTGFINAQRGLDDIMTREYVFPAPAPASSLKFFDCSIASRTAASACSLASSAGERFFVCSLISGHLFTLTRCSCYSQFSRHLW